MQTGKSDSVVLSTAAQNVLRILIASYFIAAALQLIPGTDLTPLTSQIAPAPYASILAAVVVFGLAYLVMIGVWMRGAALLLGLMTFFASYLKMLELGLEQELGSFWRDLALIAALILTYAENAPQNRLGRRAIRRHVTPRRIRRTVEFVAPEDPEQMPEGVANRVARVVAMAEEEVMPDFSELEDDERITAQMRHALTAP
ncbi:hypothetical protein GTA62_14980 [Roseobacter sp. HKCCD9010]|uniref:DoxX family protein n=1 Tax=unclassified Roseobacter TaxID=196798 RepID=UPI00149155ED|nr:MULTISPECIES: DoxX family protein [unclassified Roseobacter]MBF9050585.1 hypothetical protein [Rhodobacterales bacterium HKCCD4356]NNV11996.1 hypothetical protein [Roseobacter sp. HKCCD7357]NNV17009.1 hypothetical protein [Roseobacter sp. HKCCD8768]NNV26239.1 hypothetical protein [Roseobacter sp. HKCCD8192]NNV30734.1 hypothetical protein [Roseobacter sp. HKCCD9061]